MPNNFAQVLVRNQKRLDKLILPLIQNKGDDSAEGREGRQQDSKGGRRKTGELPGLKVTWCLCPTFESILMDSIMFESIEMDSLIYIIKWSTLDTK